VVPNSGNIAETRIIAFGLVPRLAIACFPETEDMLFASQNPRVNVHGRGKPGGKGAEAGIPWSKALVSIVMQHA